MTTIALKKIIVASAKMTQKLVVGGNATGTAPASEVLDGSTFSNMYAVDLVGTMPNIGAQNITPSATEQTISEGYHDGSGKVAGDADLVAENIKKDVQIFGVTGTLESGTAATGNATVDQVLSGATFSNATSNDLTGTMPNIGAQNITPSANNQSISAGYHNGSGVVAGDADLVAGNIKKDAVIFGVTGTFEGDVSTYKTALDAANEEASADLTAGIALVDTNYGEISAAIAAAGVSVTGVKPSGYDAKIAEAVAKATNEALFDFRTDTKTLLPYCYNSYIGPTDVVIPATIAGIAVENIAGSAFVSGVIDKRGITSIYIPDSVKTMGVNAATNNPIGAVRLSQNVAFTTIPTSAFNSGTGTMTEVEIPANITTIQQYAFAFQPIVKIIIGAGVDVFFDATYATMGTNGAGFKTLYDAGGKLAGTYEYNAGTWSKTA